MAYEKVGWKDYPDKTTPTSAANLNKMDEGIANNDKNIGDMSKVSDQADGTLAGIVAAQAEEIKKLKKENSELSSNMTLNVGFFNPTKVIKRLLSPEASYTATEDCWAVGYALANASTTVNITLAENGYTATIYTSMNTTGNERHMFPIKKGQTLNIIAGGFDFNIYGMY